MKKGKIANNLLFSFMVLSLILLMGTTARGALSGSFENELSITQTESQALSYKGRLNVDYMVDGINFQSTSVFSEDGYETQDFGTSFSLGLVDLNSTISFDPQNKRLDYFLTNGGFTFGEIGIDNAFLLEYTEKTSGYGAGYGLTLSYKLSEGPYFYIKNYLGMEPNEAEALGLEKGSGYTLVTNNGDYGPSKFQYVGTTIELSDLSLGCCDFRSTSKLTEEKGFEYSLFEFDLNSTNFPFQLEADLKFSPQTKSLELNPRIDLGWGCFDVYTDISTEDDENLLGKNGTNENKLGGLEIEGFGLKEVAIGDFYFSSLTALKGGLFGLVTKSDLDLRAHEYVLDPDPVYSGLYKNNNYDQVISVEKRKGNTPIYLAGDVYFDMSGSQGLFDFGMFTGSGSYLLSDQFTLGAALSAKPLGFEVIRLTLDYRY